MTLGYYNSFLDHQLFAPVGDSIFFELVILKGAPVKASIFLELAIFRGASVGDSIFFGTCEFEGAPVRDSTFFSEVLILRGAPVKKVTLQNDM